MNRNKNAIQYCGCRHNSALKRKGIFFLKPIRHHNACGQCTLCHWPFGFQAKDAIKYSLSTSLFCFLEVKISIPVNSWETFANIFQMCFISSQVIYLWSRLRKTLRWRHNGPDSVWNHQPNDCLFNRLFRRRSKKTSKLRVTDLCEFTGDPHKWPVARKMFPFDDVIMNHEGHGITQPQKDNTWSYAGICWVHVVFLIFFK